MQGRIAYANGSLRWITTGAESEPPAGASFYPFVGCRDHAAVWDGRLKEDQHVFYAMGPLRLFLQWIVAVVRGGCFGHTETGVLWLHALKCCLMLGSMPSAEILSHIHNFPKVPCGIWHLRGIRLHNCGASFHPFWIFIIFISWTTDLNYTLKVFYLITWFDERPLFRSTFSRTFLYKECKQSIFLSHFWRLILESLNLFIFLANILQGNVPGLCGPSPGAKLKLPFYNIYSLRSKCKCKFHTVLHSSKINFYCDWYFCREEAPTDLRMQCKNHKSSLVTEN